MKIAYLLNYPVDRKDGVTLKMNTQIQNWSNEGNEVEAFNLFEVAEHPEVNTRQYYCGNVVQKKMKICKALVSDINKFSPDLIYLRFTYWNRTLGFLQKKYRNIIEINTDDLSELKSNFKNRPSFKKAIMWLLDLLLRGPVLKNADGFVSVTEELALRQSFSSFKKDTLICPNSYDCSSVIQRKNADNINERTGLFFIGSPGHSCHGIDHIIWLAENLPEYDFHIIGTDGENTDNTFFHGYMNKNDYLKIMKSCSVCISSLAPYRKNISEGSALKVREYIAHGYPVILGGKDAAFSEEPELPEWVLELDFRSNINLSEVRDFIEKTKDVVIDKDAAEQLIDSKYIEKRRLNFFNEIVNKEDYERTLK